jgi:hypothetical protein
MSVATQGDFLGDGSGGGIVDPFAGLAPAQDPAAQEAARRAQLANAATQTANINAAYNAQRATGDQQILNSSNAVSDADRAANPRHTFFGALVRDPVTMGVLAAPLAVTGAGAALGGAAGLGFGLGEGTIGGTVAGSEAATGLGVGGEAAGAAGAHAGGAAAANAAANAAAGVTVDSGLAAGGVGAGTAAGLAGGAAGAAAASAPWWAGPALTGGLALAPLAIQAATGGRTKEESALLEKQQQLAQEAKVRQGQQQDARMNSLGQQLLAFNPRNQMMSQMFGPGAAFTPEQMAQMVQGSPPPNDPYLATYAGDDQATLQQKREMQRRQVEYQQAEQGRRDMMMGGFQQPGAGPAPMQMPAPQAARKY